LGEDFTCVTCDCVIDSAAKAVTYQKFSSMVLKNFSLQQLFHFGRSTHAKNHPVFVVR
jgi:hypothetical protein